ncbi:MAG: hypothetical protein [Microviridae sp.]|nr:MAG: hypothetical protein [Microviridae sp.]
MLKTPVKQSHKMTQNNHENKNNGQKFAWVKNEETSDLKSMQLQQTIVLSWLQFQLEEFKESVDNIHAELKERGEGFKIPEAQK